MIEKNDILSGLATEIFGKTIFCFETINSTNTFAKTLTKENAPHGTLIVAEEQTAGRGRMLREWNSQKEKNLLFSIILYPTFGKEKISLLPFTGALAVIDAIESLIDISPASKWPNDILLNGKKICGMLLEAQNKKIILGIGINVNQTEFADELLYKATSLKKETGTEIDRTLLLKKILEELEHRYAQLSSFPAQQLLNDWKLKASFFGKKITVLESEFSFSAVALDIAKNGSLIIQTDDGTKRNIFAGDVSVAYN